MVFCPDRVELCGVIICSGPRSQTKRKILNLLRTKRSDGGFVAYSGEELARQLRLAEDRGQYSGAIRDLRDDIIESLRSQANLECGRQDVILSGGPGYRFANGISVQDGKGMESPPMLQGHENTDSPSDVPVNVPVNVPVDVPVDSDDADSVSDSADAAVARQKWILEQVTKGRKMRAPRFAAELGCSDRTVKRDLDALESKSRVRGFTAVGLLPTANAT